MNYPTNADKRAEDMAERGMELLERHYPGCHNTINLVTLSVGNITRCPVAQLHQGQFGRGVEKLGIDSYPGESAYYGFCLGQNNSRLTYPRLDAAWHRVILKRRREDTREKLAKMVRILYGCREMCPQADMVTTPARPVAKPARPGIKPAFVTRS
jgi:hypothetical protein